jgi:hypothetical protein
LVKNLYPKHFRRISVIMGKGYGLHLITLFNCRRSLIQRTLPSFLGIMKEGLAHLLSCWGMRMLRHITWSSLHLNVDTCIQGTGYGHSCTGFASGSISIWTFLWG